MRQPQKHQWRQWFRGLTQHPWLLHLFQFIHQPHEFASLRGELNQATMDLRDLVEVMEHALSGISRLDQDGRYLYANKAYASMLGMLPGAMIGMDWKQTVLPDDLDALKLAYQQMVQKGKVEVEARGLRQDGSSFYKRLVMIASYDQRQNFIGHYCFAKDITDRKQMEASLRKEVLRNRMLYDASVDGIVVMDRQGNVLQSSASFARMLGYNMAETLGLNVADWDAQWSQAELQQMLSGAIEVPPVFETRHRRKDGSFYDVEISYNRLQTEDDVLHFCICRDFSDRKQSEMALQDSQARFAGILEIASDAIISINAAQQITLFNRGAERTFGYSSEEILGQPLSLLIPGRFTGAHQQHVDHYGQSAGKARQMGERGAIFGRRKDGTEFPAEASISKLTLHGEPIFTAFLRDISDSKQKELALQQAMEAAEAANLAKSMFLANMSHELRTPLNVILGFAQVMGHDASLNQTQRDDLQTIRRSGDHLLSLINNILDLSKIDAGHARVENTAFDLIALLHSLRTMLAARAEAKGLRLECAIAPEVPQFVIADEQKIQQILLNLLSNAIKFTQEGGVIFQVGVQNKSQSVPWPSLDALVFLHIQVSDTGAGIAPEELNLIFDAFVQAQAGRQSTTGTGLGLTISRKLLELMGGDISVQSVVGQGSTFKFVLPVQLASGTAIQPVPENRAVVGLAPDQPQYRILIVDDQAENRRLMVRLLTPLGVEIREATNGQDAIHIWQEWQPHLTWMDIQMPGIDGYTATLQIREQEASVIRHQSLVMDESQRTKDKGQNTIIIALTAQASQSDRTLALSAGCNDYISKPFQQQTVYLKMTEYLGLQYRYAEPVMSDDAQPVPSFAAGAQLMEPIRPPAIILPDPATLPTGWFTDLEKAAMCGDDRVIITLAKHLPPESAQLAVYLIDLASQYQFEQILQIIRPPAPT